MNTSRFVMAAIAATLISTAAFAAPPSADQVAVPQGASMHHNKIKAMFDSPNEFVMFRLDVHQATRGMDHDQKKAYRKAQIQKLKSMTTAERTNWLHGLQAKWDALPADRKAALERKMERFAAHHQNRQGNHGQGDDGGDQMDQSR